MCFTRHQKPFNPQPLKLKIGSFFCTVQDLSLSNFVNFTFDGGPVLLQLALLLLTAVTASTSRAVIAHIKVISMLF